ncbi:unnamed protein product [Spodoptera exigua]|nr:unnamed protein product [Spodoptera exigua]
MRYIPVLLVIVLVLEVAFSYPSGITAENGEIVEKFDDKAKVSKEDTAKQAPSTNDEEGSKAMDTAEVITDGSPFMYNKCPDDKVRYGPSVRHVAFRARLKEPIDHHRRGPKGLMFSRGCGVSAMRYRDLGTEQETEQGEGGDSFVEKSWARELAITDRKPDGMAAFSSRWLHVKRNNRLMFTECAEELKPPNHNTMHPLVTIKLVEAW